MKKMMCNIMGIEFWAILSIYITLYHFSGNIVCSFWNFFRWSFSICITTIIFASFIFTVFNFTIRIKIWWLSNRRIIMWLNGAYWVSLIFDGFFINFILTTYRFTSIFIIITIATFSVSIVVFNTAFLFVRIIWRNLCGYWSDCFFIWAFTFSFLWTFFSWCWIFSRSYLSRPI